MDDFVLYFKMGLQHVLDFSGYDHILFLIVLAVIFTANQWKKALWLVTFFTLGHSLTLALAAYGVINFNIDIIEFLIAFTIFITGVINVFRANKAGVGKDQLNLFFALFFGLIHGLGFSNYFKMMIGRSDDKLMPLVEFALGIETAQIIIVVVLLILASLTQALFKVSKRDWIMVLSAIVIGVILPILVARFPW